MQAVDIIELICNKLGIVANWTEETAMPYLQSLMTQLATAKANIHYTMLFIFGALIIIGLICILIGSSEECGVAGVFILIIGIVGFVVAMILYIQWRDMPTMMSYRWIMNALRGS